MTTDERLQVYEQAINESLAFISTTGPLEYPLPVDLQAKMCHFIGLMTGTAHQLLDLYRQLRETAKDQPA